LDSLEHSPIKRKRSRECEDNCVNVSKECSIYLHPGYFLNYHNMNALVIKFQFIKSKDTIKIKK